MNEDHKTEIEATDIAPQAPDMATEDAAALAEDAQAKLKAVEAEVAGLKDRLLRAVAETENVRRRAERERADATTYAITGFARDLLNVADNLRRALEAVSEAQRADEGFATVLAGVEMTERELLASFDKHGIRKIVPKDEKFDHNFHQAMFEVETSAVAPGTVVEVMQPGYVLKDRLLRPAMVGVAKAPKTGDTNKPAGVNEVV
ncbi:MAG: nucleotide exchange factor GrpE [Pseudomonadota bacterium]